MITLGKTYSSRLNVPEQAKPVVLFRSSEMNNSKINRFVASALMVVSVSVLSLQTGFVLNASAEESPISAPVSTQETPSPSPSAPVTSPEVTPSPTSTPNNNSNPQPSNNGGGGNGGSSGGGSSSAPSCNNEAPKAPKIVTATSANKNEITLFWEKPTQGNVTHYSISYGLIKGKPLYGVTNIGNVTSYTVKGLSAGVTYYFIVNAVNGCTAGPVSNEVGIKGGGKFINTPAVGFKPAVIGSTKTVQFKNKNQTASVIESPKPINIKFESGNSLNPGLLGKAFSFFKGLFN